MTLESRLFGPKIMLILFQINVRPLLVFDYNCVFVFNIRLIKILIDDKFIYID